MDYIDSLAKILQGAAADPAGTAKRYVAGMNQQAGQNLDALGALYKDPQGNVTFDRSQWSPEATAGNDSLVDQMAAAMMGTVAPVGKLAALKEGPHYAVRDLSEYTPSLYRETSIDSANHFLPGNMTQPQTLHFANDPAYALGQGANKGVMMEFDAKNMPGQLNLSKPTARQSYNSGYAEFLSRDADPAALGANLRSIAVNPEAQSGPYFRRLKNSMQQQGWNSAVDENGIMRFVKP